MRAAVCYEFGQPLVVEEVLLDAPGTGELEVRVGACAVCHSDISYLEGAWGGRLPAVYGHEAVGVVAKVGPGVEGVAADELVLVTPVRSCGGCYFCARGEPAFCESSFPLDEYGPLRSTKGETITQGLRTGAFAERVVVHASQIVAIPEDVPLASAALLACGVIPGFGAVVNAARVRVGDSVVVIGTGGVGQNSVQAAALSGAQTIVAVDLDDGKLETAKTFGATHTVNPTKENLRVAVFDLTQGRGADHALVTVGTKAAIEGGLELVRPGGNLVVVGMPASGVTARFDPTELAHGGRRILGSKLGSARPDLDVPKLVELYRGGKLKLDELVSGRYALDEINEAVASTNQGEALRNVIVFGAAP